MSIVAEGRELISQGELIQLVLSVGFESPFDGDPFDVYRRLRRLNPSPYMFHLKEPGISLAVSSPEVMVSCIKDRLRLCPIAGTRPRGQDGVEDDLFESELIDDPKERSEHVMLVDLGRNDLGRVAKPGTVEVVRFMEVERFSHVMHLTSHLGADLAPGLTAVDVLAATFPAGTLTGAPKIKAMELIARMEGIDRGPYGGAIGWLGLDKDSVNLDLGITIRSLWVRDGRVFFRAGAGVVYDSDPASEWAECQAKAAAVSAALTGASKGVHDAAHN
jgi:anthranilate synthase component 1